MNSLHRTIAVALTASFTMLVASGAAAQNKPADAPPLKVAAVDTREVGQRSTAVQAVQKKIQQWQRRLQADYVKEQQRIQKAAKELRENPRWRGAELARRRNELNQQLVEARRTFNVRRRQLAQASQQVGRKFQLEVIQIVKALSIERGYNLVLDKAVTIHVIPQFDITKDVVERLNKSLKELELNFPPKGKDEAPPKKK